MMDLAFLAALGDIDDDLVEDAAPRPRPKIRWLRYTSVAAMLVLVAAIAVFYPWSGNKLAISDKEQNEAVPTDSGAPLSSTTQGVINEDAPDDVLGDTTEISPQGTTAGAYSLGTTAGKGNTTAKVNTAPSSNNTAQGGDGDACTRHHTVYHTIPGEIYGLVDRELYTAYFEQHHGEELTIVQFVEDFQIAEEDFKRARGITEENMDALAVPGLPDGLTNRQYLDAIYRYDPANPDAAFIRSHP